MRSFVGLEETDIVPFGGMLYDVKVDKSAQVLATFVPQFPVYPPETAWMREPVTNIPGIIVRETQQGGRVAFLPADLDRQYAINNHPDPANIIRNIVRWALHGNEIVQVEGVGLVDVHVYEQSNRLVLHMVNLTSASTWRQPLEELIAVGPFNIKVKLPKGIRGRNTDLKVSKEKIKTDIADGWLSFSLTSVLDHELIIIS